MVVTHLALHTLKFQWTVNMARCYCAVLKLVMLARSAVSATVKGVLKQSLSAISANAMAITMYLEVLLMKWRPAVMIQSAVRIVRDASSHCRCATLGGECDGPCGRCPRVAPERSY